ncbi:MAG: VOC family protein [Kordiimonadaceae bacterium]|nr:VOC family protein [Kordiimonadaceae bacterium]
MSKITPFLWFDHQAEDAANFYVSIFKNSKINNIARYAKSAEAVSGKKAGDVMTISFELNGQKFTALNGGPHFTFSPAISFMIDCADQDEVDYYWEKLSDGGEPGQCGWLTDKFGVSWQVVPRTLGELMSSAAPEKAERVMTEMLKMTKMDIEKLKNA